LNQSSIEEKKKHIPAGKIPRIENFLLN